MSGFFKFPEGNRNPVPPLRFGVPQVRGRSPQAAGSSPSMAGVPQIRGGSYMLGSARFATRAPWVGPPYTQVTPPPAFMFSRSAEKPGKRKAETDAGECMIFFVLIIYDIGCNSISQFG